MNKLCYNIYKNKSLDSIFKINKFYAGGKVPTVVTGHHIKAPKVKDYIVWINFISQVGQIRRLPGFPGQDLDDLLVKYKTPYFLNTCGGTDGFRKISDAQLPWTFLGATCGSCHVRIHDPWFSQMKPNIHRIEHHTLSNQSSTVHNNSRLACGIKLKPWMNEMIVTQVRTNDYMKHYKIHDRKFEDYKYNEDNDSIFYETDIFKKKE